MNRRSLFGALALATVDLTAMAKGRRVLKGENIGIGVEQYIGPAGSKFTEFAYIDTEGGPPLEVGELVYWNGREFNCPVIDGEVVLVRQQERGLPESAVFQDVVVKGDG